MICFSSVRLSRRSTEHGMHAGLRKELQASVEQHSLYREHIEDEYTICCLTGY